MKFVSSLRARLDASARESRTAAVLANSFVVRGVARATVLGWCSLSAEQSALGRLVTRRPLSNFDALVQVSSESALYRLIASAGAACSGAAWEASAARRFLQNTIAPIDIAGRIRLAAWAGIVMAIVRIALSPAVPTGLMLTRFWLPLLAVCLVCFGGAPVLARWFSRPSACPDSVPGSRFS